MVTWKGGTRAIYRRMIEGCRLRGFREINAGARSGSHVDFRGVPSILPPMPID